MNTLCQIKICTTHPGCQLETRPCRCRSQIQIRSHQEFMSQRVFIQSLCRSQFTHKSVNWSFIITHVKNKLTDWCGNWLLQIDFLRTRCEIRIDLVDDGVGARSDRRIFAPKLTKSCRRNQSVNLRMNLVDDGVGARSDRRVFARKLANLCSKIRLSTLE
jgi:hypothetical protein